MPSLSAVLRRLSPAGRPGRALALELGPHGARALLARSRPGGEISVERALAVDLRAEGLLGPEESSARLRGLVAGLPAAPAVLVLPPGRTHSQFVELRDEDRRAPAELARSLGGRGADKAPHLADARILPAAAGQPRRAWITVAREEDVADALARAGLPPDRVARVVGADAALAAAFATIPARPSLAALVFLGPAEGLLLVVEHDRPAFAAELDWGAEQFVQALAADLARPADTARAILARDGADALSPATPRLAARLNGLRLAVEALLRDHAREAARDPVALLAAPRLLCAAGLSVGRAREPLAAALAAAPWPGPPAAAPGETTVLDDAVLAYGAAALVFGSGPETPDLSPPVVRAARRADRRVAALHAAALLLAVLGLGAAAHALHARSAVAREHAAVVAGLREARDAVPELLAARAARETAYQEALPALYLQRRTRDFVAGTRLLRERLSAGDFWFALVADIETYQSGALPKGTPAAAPETQLLPGCLLRPGGLVVELSFRPGGANALDRVGAIIAELRAAGVFTGVDILPPRARRPGLADQSVFASEGAAYALQLDTAPFPASAPSAQSAPQTAPGLFNPAPR